VTHRAENPGVFVIAEIGINHNGDIELAQEMIREAARIGCDAVKFQKRTIDLVYSPAELDRPRESPFGTTNREQKLGLEFGPEEYSQIENLCKELQLQWFASPWDLKSVEFLAQFDLAYNKIASPMLTVTPLVEAVASQGRYTFISTGMSTIDEIEAAVGIFRKHGCPFELMHCNSTYPMNDVDANLSVIETLKTKFSCDVGYSGHESGSVVSLSAVALGATSIERHLTLDRKMYGSDQAASIEVSELEELIKMIRVAELVKGSPNKRLLDSEKPAREKLSKPYWYTQKS